MREDYRQRKSPVVLILVVLLIMAAAGAVYFYIDGTTVNMEIAAIDSAQYSQAVYDKGEQHAAEGIPISAEITEELSENVYKTPLGFSIISYSQKWKGEKLVEIYNELLKNEHGDEIAYVSEVDVFPGASDMDSSDSYIAGTQSSKQESYPVFFDLPSLVPNTLKYMIKPTESVIELYNMDKFDNASQAARTIAHEYGHHYTTYYFLKNHDVARNTEYYNLRDLGNIGHEVIFDNWKDYMANYDWDIFEMAAEDYVQLMGSPDAREVMQYKDIKEISDSGQSDYRPKVNDRTVNVFPQNNIYISLADEVPGLRDYYYSFIGKQNNMTELHPANFDLKIKEYSNYGNKYYKISWTKTSTDPQALYTLVCFDKEGVLFWPVKTVSGDEDAVAVVGTATTRKDYIDHYTLSALSDNIPKESRIFKLYLILPDGRMQSSEPFNVDF